MASPRSPSRERDVNRRGADRDRRRDRSWSPKESRRERKHKRSRSPRIDRERDRDREKDRHRDRDRHRDKDKERERKRSRHSPSKESRRRSLSPAQAKTEDGELPAPVNGTKEKASERSKSLERRTSPLKDHRRSPHGSSRHDLKDRGRSRSKERRRSLSRERGRPKEDRRSKTAEKEDGASAVNGTSHPKAEAAEDAAKKAEPLSLEEYMKKKKEEEEALAKPKFLSKKQREELALQRLKEQSESKKQRSAEVNGSHNPYKDAAEKQRQDRKRDADRRLEEDRLKVKEEREREKELELIKKQYLGTEKVKKKIRKPSEKFHLNFDWEVTDDTSKDLNPIYNQTHEAALLFGSGKRAGVDVQEQKKLAAEHQRQLLKKMRQAQGLKETKQDRERDRERKRLAEAYNSLDSKNLVKEHWSSKKREDMTERDWRIFREDFNISYKGVNVSGSALPYRSWEEATLPDSLMKAITELGYKKPSPIQMASIPLGLLQRDVIGVAETGSGKTAAFVLPMLCYLMQQPEMTEEIATEGPYSVVMAPVRELAQQIEEETIKLAKHTPYRTVSVVGGQDIGEQAFKLRKGCEIVICTPGRLLDCVEQSYAVLNQCNYVVLDEADRMIDMGFEPQVMGVLDAMPASNLKPEAEDGILEENRVYRTTYMFSATMPPPVERLARKYMRRPAVINIGSAGKATDNVTQKVYMVKDNEKLGILQRELELVNEKRAIVFVNTKKSCDIVSRHLDMLEYACTVLHGGKTQDQREASLLGFREEKYNVLVATDVAGRGIDVPDVALVINYDMPTALDQYTHRIGRTARAGRTGLAVTLLTPQDTEMYYDLKKFLEESGAPVPSQLAHHEAARNKPGAVDKPRRETTVYARH